MSGVSARSAWDGPRDGDAELGIGIGEQASELVTRGHVGQDAHGVVAAVMSRS